MLHLFLYLTLQVVLLAAWVSGTLDPLQKKLQELILDAMGETKVSYGLKSKWEIIINSIQVRTHSGM